MPSVIGPVLDVRRVFPPEQVVQAKAIACELPAQRQEPLSRYGLSDIVLILKREQIVSSISRATLWRWFYADALRPWRYRPWLFRRDPHFLERATVVLELYQGFFEGQALGPKDYLVSADEKAGLQVLARLAPTRGPIPGHAGQVEFEYERRGTLCYQAALDVRAGTVIGQVVDSNSIETFTGLVDRVMQQAPYAEAERVFWVVDGGASHHRATFPARLSGRYRNAIAVHLPVHASWLNQIELYFSILQRKALTPRAVESQEALAARLLGFQGRYNATARPFTWKFTAADLRERLRLVEAVPSEEGLPLAA